jgi:hypothetical protein
LLALLWEHDQKVLYVPGLSVEIELATPTAENPKRMPAMPASSLIKLG